MAGLSPADIAVPIRSQLSGYPNVRVLLGGVTSLDPLSLQETRSGPST